MPKKNCCTCWRFNEMTKASANLAINIYNYAHTNTDIYKSVFLQTTIQARIASSFKKWWPTSFIDQKFHHISWMRHNIQNKRNRSSKNPEAFHEVPLYNPAVRVVCVMSAHKITGPISSEAIIDPSHCNQYI